VSRDEAGNMVVRLDEATQRRVALRTAPLAAAEHRPELAALGVLVEDPSLSFTLRAPFPGRLVGPERGSWPALGSEMAAEAVAGRLEPRFSPTEQVDLSARLAEAQANVDAIRAELDAAKASYDRKRELNRGAQKMVSDQVLKEAEAAVKSQEARLEAAQASIKILRASLAATTQPAGAFELTLPVGGRVIEVNALPGESVENGQPLLRITRFHRLLARVALPAGVVLGAPVATARIAVGGHQDVGLTGQWIGPDASANDTTGGAAYLFSVMSDQPALQPGLPVTAYLEMPGEPRAGVMLPRSSLIRYQARVWAYVRTAPEQFTRREAVSAVPLPEGWFVPEGFEPGERVVTVGAQSLLSEELRWQVTGTEEEEE